MTKLIIMQLQNIKKAINIWPFMAEYKVINCKQNVPFNDI